MLRDSRNNFGVRCLDKERPDATNHDGQISHGFPGGRPRAEQARIASVVERIRQRIFRMGEQPNGCARYCLPRIPPRAHESSTFSWLSVPATFAPCLRVVHRTSFPCCGRHDDCRQGTRDGTMDTFIAVPRTTSGWSRLIGDSHRRQGRLFQGEGCCPRDAPECHVPREVGDRPRGHGSRFGQDAQGPDDPNHPWRLG